MQHHPTHFLLSLLFLLLLSQLATASSASFLTRQSRNNTLVDFSTAPSCLNPSCDPSNPGFFSWTSDNLYCNNGGEGVTHDCFCNTASRPLLCQPYNPSDPSDCYFAARKWYNNLCGSGPPPSPETSPLYSPIAEPGMQKTISVWLLPDCARTCTVLSLARLGCADNALNCACQSPTLAANAAMCIKANCNGDIHTYIGNLTTFAAKWISQSCEYTQVTQRARFTGDGDQQQGITQREKFTGGDQQGAMQRANFARGDKQGLSKRDDHSAAAAGDWENYPHSPAAVPQEVLIPDFHGPEYTSWQSALDAKRERNSNLGAIIPLSLIFGSIFGFIALQWLLQACGCDQRNSVMGKLGRNCLAVVAILIVPPGKLIIAASKWVWKVTKPVRIWAGKVFWMIMRW